MAQDGDGNWLDEALARLPQARVAVLGDFCLDAYWLIDPDESEVAVETGPHEPEPVDREAALAELRDLQKQLAELQGESPLILPSVD